MGEFFNLNKEEEKRGNIILKTDFWISAHHNHILIFWRWFLTFSSTIPYWFSKYILEKKGYPIKKPFTTGFLFAIFVFLMITIIFHYLNIHG